MTVSRHQSRAAFTLVELLIGITLSLMVMTAVLSTYVFLGRNFTRSLGLSGSNQPNLDGQARRTLATFAQDVGMASAIVGTPSSTAVTLTVATATGTKSVAYYFNNTAAAVTTTLASYSTTVPAMSLVRVDGSNGTATTLHTRLLSCTINYYDSTGGLYTVFSTGTSGFSSFSGIKQMNLEFTSQAGTSANGTLTQVFYNESPRVVLRNKPWLP